MVALKYISSQLNAEEVWFLAHKSKCGTIEEEEEKKKKFISFQPFLRALRRSLQEASDMFAMRSQYLQELEA